MKRLMVILVALVIAGLGQASTVEDALWEPCTMLLGEDLAQEACRYQFDAGAHGDASDDCDDPYPALTMPTSIAGILVPHPLHRGDVVEDREDNYLLDIAADQVDTTFSVTLRLAPGLEATSDVSINAWGPAGASPCATLLAGATTSDTVTVIVQPQTPGPHTIQVRHVDVRIDTDPSLSIPLVCHFMCMSIAQAAVGYHLNITSPP